jgi:PAS domain S-box-containing protein
MKPTEKSSLIIYRIAVIFIAILWLLVSTSFSSDQAIWAIVPLAILNALLVYYPINILDMQTTVLHAINLPAGLTYGQVVVGWAALIGIVSGYLLRSWRKRKSIKTLLLTGDELVETGMVIGLQIIPISFALSATRWSGQPVQASEGIGLANLGTLIAPVVMMVLVRLVLIVADLTFRSKKPLQILWRDSLPFGLVEWGSLPLPLTAYVLSPTPGFINLLFLAGISFILALIMFRFSLLRAAVVRSQQEFSVLTQISEVVRSNLVLENLLDAIHRGVTQLTGVENFFVALFDADEKRIWYPLAVKRGERQNWTMRPIMPDRLTDRVISEGKAILLNPRDYDSPGQIGLPPSVETPVSWMGVPLISSERTIGCLAIFTLTPGSVFTQPDLNLLNILSGQISVAIENALLYEQTQQRTRQLETLNKISTLISGSLNPQEVLEQTCRSVAHVTGGERSAVFLLDPDKGQLNLAYAFGLSEEFVRLNQSFVVTQTERMRCLRSGAPVLSPTLSMTTLDAAYIGSLQKEGIQAFAEFPLTTPNGHVGILTVYYDIPYTFKADEVELIQTFASQAALAVANAHLHAHVDMALARRVDQLSILEAVGRELAAAIGSDRLFEMILDYAIGFTHSTWGELSLYDDRSQTLEVKAARGFTVSRNQFPVSEGLEGKVLQTQKAVNIGNIQKHPKYVDLTNKEASSQLCVPLIHEENVLGVLSLLSAQMNAYNENDQAFISQLATQAAVAVVNAKLYTDAQRRLRELSILHMVSTRLVINPELEKVMQTVAHSMESSLQASSVGIYLWDEDRSEYVSRYSLQSPTTPDCNIPPRIAYAELGPIHTALLKTGPLRLAAKPINELLGECKECQALVYPLIASKQRIGMILIHIPITHIVRDDELQLLRAVVAQVSISLQNALLFEDMSRVRDRLSAVLNTVGEGIIMLEMNGMMMLTNEFIHNITGSSREELVNKPFTGLTDSALNALGYSRQEAETLVKDLESGKAISTPKTILKSAETKPIRVLERSTSPVWGQGRRMIGWLIIYHDVTEEYQVAQARELITGTLVHDLRAPAGAILSAVDVISELLPTNYRDDVIEQALRVSRNGANRMLSLVDTLLDIARMQSGRMDLNLIMLDFHHLVTNAIVEFVPQANEFGIILRNEVPETLPKVCADQGKLTRIITNLLDNALKFTPSGGQVVISAEQTPHSELVVHVSDTGPGVPEEYREKIFDRFTQVPGMLGRRRGSGLGLTFCRMAVEAHGGRIWVEPRSPENGSVFSFSMPLLSQKKLGV